MYIAQINIKTLYGTDGGCYKLIAESLDEIREWAKRTGKAGDMLTIIRNGSSLKDARVITI